MIRGKHSLKKIMIDLFWDVGALTQFYFANKIFKGMTSKNFKNHYLQSITPIDMIDKEAKFQCSE